MKDNVTLCHTLQFMSCMFETLSSTSSDSTSIAADVLCMLNDAIAAIVEPMALFLQESYSGSILHSNISNDASALDTSKALLRRAVSVSYLQLLFLLSGYHMNLRVLLPLAAQSTPSPRVRLSEIMDGHRLVAILLQASTSEILSAHERSFAAGIISNLLSFHNGLYLMNSIEQGNFTKSYVFQGIEYRNLGVLDCMIKSIRLLRTPDSMVGTAGVVGSLRILLLCLKQHEQNGTVRHAMQEAAEAQSGGSGSGSSPRSAWHWLARVMYDRRSEVKVLAMKIFMMVLKYGQSKNDKRAAANAFDMTEDSLQGQLQQDQHEERIGGAETGGDEADEAVEQWPPLDMIVQVMCDSTESFALRCCALEIMVQIAAQQSSGECRVNLGAIISSVFDLLTLRDELAGPLTMEMAMSSLLALYQWSVQSQQERYFMQLLRSMKVLPVMIDILNPGLLFISLQRGMQRMQMDTSELMKNHSVGNDDPAVVPIVMAAGWNHMSKAFFKTSRTALLNCRKQVSCFLLGISTTAAPCFAECVDRTRLIPNSLISLITLLSNPRYICSSPGAVQMYFASVESASDMLSLIIGNESLGTGDDAAVAVAASASAEGSMPLQTAGRPMSQFVIENCLLPEQLLCAMKSFFLWAAAARRGASNHSSVRGMSAVLRLLTVIVNDDLWRSYLRFGGQSGFSEMDENAKDLFCTLLATQRSLVHENGAKSEMEAGDAIVAHRLNCCLAAIVQYSAAARSLLTKAFLESSAPCSKSNAVMGDARVEFLRVHFDCIRMAAERLVKGSCESGHDGAMQSSLRDLKNKTTATKAGAGAGRGAKGSSDGAEKGSTPSPWARKPTTTGKW